MNKQAGIVREARRPRGFSPEGPEPLGGIGPEAGEDLCFLSGNFRIFQRQHGHRWSVDDLVTAHEASFLVEAGSLGFGDPKTDPAPLRVLDLGCGIGSVLMMLAWRCRKHGRSSRHLGVEAETTSADLARRSIRYNGLCNDVRVLEADFRAPPLGGISDSSPFDMITGTPPYFDDAEGRKSEREQCVPCRFETRGGVEAYVEVAAPLLRPNGRLVICINRQNVNRALASATENCLAARRRIDVHGRRGKESLFSVLIFSREAAPLEEAVLEVRDNAGQWTEDFRAVRTAMGMPVLPGRG